VSLDDRLRRLTAAVFGIGADVITDASSPASIEAWDSVRHIQLVLALEGEFGVAFDPDEIPALTSVGAIRSRLERAGVR